MTINKQLLPMKAHYFLWNGGTGPVTSYLSSYARQLGLSSVTVGLIYIVLPVSGMVAKPFFGSIADRFYCQKLLFLLAQLLTAAAFLGLFFSPKMELVRQVEFGCSNDSLVISKQFDGISECSLDDIRKAENSATCQLKCSVDVISADVLCHTWNQSEFCSTNYPKTFQFSSTIQKNETHLVNSSIVTFIVFSVTISNNSNFQPPMTPSFKFSTCDIECKDYMIYDLLPEPAIDDNKVYGISQFWSVLILMTIGWVGQAVVVSIGDAICFELLGDKPGNYGYQRMYGALGWGIIAAVSGALIDAFSEGKSQKNYAPAFYIAAAFIVCDFLVSSQLKYTQKRVITNICRDVGLLFLNIRVIVFLLWCISAGMCTGIVWQFLFWLMEDLAGAQGCSGLTYIKTLQGLSQAVQSVLGETPFFFLSGKIINKLGHVHTMSLVLFAVGVRFILYSVIDNPWYFLPIEISNGLTFGLCFACMASYASNIAPTGTEATMQGLVGAVFEGIGVSAGSSLAGISYNKYGGSLTFRYFGIGAWILCVVHIAVQYLLKVNQYQYTIPHEDKNEESNIVHTDRTHILSQ